MVNHTMFPSFNSLSRLFVMSLLSVKTFLSNLSSYLGQGAGIRNKPRGSKTHRFGEQGDFRVSLRTLDS